MQAWWRHEHGSRGVFNWELHWEHVHVNRKLVPERCTAVFAIFHFLGMLGVSEVEMCNTLIPVLAVVFVLFVWPPGPTPGSHPDGRQPRCRTRSEVLEVPVRPIRGIRAAGALEARIVQLF